MTPAEQLRAAKALIDTPEKWTKGEYATGPHGTYASQYSDNAVCYCAMGAIERADYLDGDWGAHFFLRKTAIERGAMGVIDFNDAPTTTHADIMKLFDDAIALAEAAQ